MAHNHEQLQKDWARLALNIPKEAREFKEGIGGEYFGYWRMACEFGLSFMEWPIAFKPYYGLGGLYSVTYYMGNGRVIEARTEMVGERAIVTKVELR